MIYNEKNIYCPKEIAKLTASNIKIKVSVLIPIYNVQKYIDKCVTSLLQNSMAKDCEFIFTDDCSTDGSYDELVKSVSKFPEMKENVKIIKHETNKGLGCARITGFDNAVGEYIICVDSDDYVEPDYLEKLYDAAKKTDADLVGCDYFREFEDGRPTRIKVNKLKSDPREVISEMLDDKVAACVWTKLFKRQFLKDKCINWEPGINMWEDQLFCIKVLMNNPKITYINFSLYHYRIRNGSYIHSLINLKNSDNLFCAVEKVFEIIKNTNDDELMNILLRRIFKLKTWLLFNCDKHVQKKYIAAYPESLKYVNDKSTKMGLARKTIFRLAAVSPKIGFAALYIYSKWKKIY